MFSSFSFPRPPSLPRPFLIFFCCEGCVFSLHPVRFIAVLSSLSPPAGVCLIREGGFVKVTHWLPIIVSFLLSSPSLPYRIHFSPWFLPPLPRPSFPSLAPRDRPVSLLVREDEIILSLDHTIAVSRYFPPSLHLCPPPPSLYLTNMISTSLSITSSRFPPLFLCPCGGLISVLFEHRSHLLTPPSQMMQSCSGKITTAAVKTQHVCDVYDYKHYRFNLFKGSLGDLKMYVRSLLCTFSLFCDLLQIYVSKCSVFLIFVLSDWGLGTKPTCLGFDNTMFWLNLVVLATKNMAGKSLKTQHFVLVLYRTIHWHSLDSKD